jgi:hypothetical protein
LQHRRRILWPGDVGGLLNHIRPVRGTVDRDDVNSTFLLPVVTDNPRQVALLFLC